MLVDVVFYCLFDPVDLFVVGFDCFLDGFF